RLGIDNSKRTLHGALLDAEILADVYLMMTGGQTNLFDEEESVESEVIRVVQEKTAEEIKSAVDFSHNLK
ncbi:hypothetical protein, partial [Streptococcus pneumoniae]